MKTRITEKDTLQTAIIHMAGGNPGAVNVLMQLIEKSPKIDPQSLLDGFGPILLLDSFNIYEYRIWMLYKDVCDQDIVKTLTCLRGCQLGFITQEELNRAIDGKSHNIIVNDLLDQVKTQLSKFNSNDW